MRASVLNKLLLFASVIALGALASAPTAGASFGYVGGLNMHGGGTSGNLLQLDAPQGIARAATGEFFVTDSQNFRILKFSSSGEFILEWGSQGSANGEFSYPNGVAVSPTTGDVWVSDSGNNRLQRFDQSGGYLGQVGGSGAGDGQFNYIGGVTVDGSGVVYATDINNNRVQYFTDAGVYSGQWGTAGSGNGQFNKPNGISVASDGAVYVVDRLNYRVQYFAPTTHAFAGKWGCNCSGDGNFVAPLGIFVDKSASPNEVYVSNDYFDHRIQRFSLTGTFLGKWGPEATLTPGSALGDLSSPSGIYVDSAHNAYVVDPGNYRIQRFSNANSTPTGVEAWGTRGDGTGQFSSPQGVAAAPDGSVYVTDVSNHRVQHVSASGAQLHVWGSTGTGNGEFGQLGGVARAPSGDIYVLEYSNEAGDADTSRVQRFSSSGVYVSQWSDVGAFGKLSYARDLDIDGAGNVYVSDGGNRRVAKFAADGTYITRWGQQGVGDNNADFQYNDGIAVNSAGTEVFVVDQQSQRIKKFDGTGAFLAQSGPHTWAGSTVDGAFNYASDIDVDPVSGDLYVADSWNYRVQRLTPGFVFVSKFGQRGRDASEFNYQAFISFDPNGYLWVADRENDRVQRFGDAPTVQIVAPSAASVTSDATPPLDYIVSDAAASCDLGDGTDLGPYTDGPQTATVTCTNLRGNGSATANFTVDTTAPVVGVSAPDGLTSDNTPPVAYTVNDAIDSSPSCDVVNGSSLPAQADGAHTVTVTCTDDAGNSGSATANFTVDTAGPVVDITTPSGSTTDDTPVVAYAVNDAIDPAPSCDVVNGSSLPAQAVGPHTVTVTCTDAAGNTGSDSSSFTVDASSPVVVLTLKKRLKAATKLKLAAECSEDCRVVATLALGRRTIKLKPVALKGREGSQRITLKLSKSQLKRVRKRLAGGGGVTLKVKVEVTYKATAGKTGKAKLSK
ncbi:MAG: hypothetical protein HZB14_07245 [Actinobacteria bacterium]|nr:hypothetical protein [Actinomycetota bacterium]